MKPPSGPPNNWCPPACVALPGAVSWLPRQQHTHTGFLSPFLTPVLAIPRGQEAAAAAPRCHIPGLRRGEHGFPLSQIIL